ncbi:MAG: heat-inducible transcriptional repressor HrcA [Bacilli bacterium]
MLTEREKLVLIAIVEEYVKTNEPVGSLALSKRPELNFSTATLRNDMAALEEMDYLEKKHTSSGRIPSEKGYRLYIEEVMKRDLNKNSNFPMIDEIFNRPNITGEQALYESMELVAQLTNYASITLGKTAYSSRIKKLEFISLKGNQAVILMVTDLGHVESKKILVPDSISINEVEKVVKVLDEVLHNALVSDIKNIIYDPSLSTSVKEYLNYHEKLVASFVNAFTDMATDKFHMSGRYNILSQPEFQDIEKAKAIFKVLEEKNIVRAINSDTTGLTIKIGTENEVKVMQDCSIITVPYESSDGTLGSISILGPTRMEYVKVIPLLEYIAKNMKKIV